MAISFLKVVADRGIPYLKGKLEPYGHVDYLAPQDINTHSLYGVNALLVRTRTHCDESLLSSANLEFIGSATIGTDHIDMNYCAERNIKVFNAPGCNVGAVQQYIASALVTIAKRDGRSLSDYTLGIIGVGNVGTRVHKLANALGMRVLLNDPPRQRNESDLSFVDLDRLLAESDIITIHVPLIKKGPDKTMYMVGSEFLKKMKTSAWLINSSRGEVADTKALIQYKGHKRYVIDVWEQEPLIDTKLLALVDISTPHIAGYSIEGKINGTRMVLKKLQEFFKLQEFIFSDSSDDLEPECGVSSNIIYSNAPEEAILQCYDIEKDHRLLMENSADFEQLRTNYALRREFSYYRIESHSAEVIKILKKLNFK